MTKKSIPNDEADLFRSAIGKVRTIQNNKVILKPEKKPRPIPIFKELEQVNPLANSVENALEILYQEDKVAYISPGLQKSVLKKLRNGQYGFDANIDLHGLSSREALKQLLRFLHDSQENGCRCVLIVHGKGYHSPDNQPVLKNDINLWLRQHKEVLAFCSAPARTGGSGALLVLLRLSEKFASQDENLS